MKNAFIKAKQEPILVFGLSLAFAGFLLIVWKYQRMIEEVSSLRWPTTTGVIENSNFYTKSNGKGRSYYGELTYRYSVKDREYMGSRYDAKGIMQTGLLGKYTEVESTMYKGAKVDVFYDPDEPSASMLENGISEDSWVRITFSSFLLLIGVNTTLKEWKRRKEWIRRKGRSLDRRKAPRRTKSK